MHRARVLEVQRTIGSLRYAVDNDLWATLESMIAGVPVDGRRSAANRARRGVIGVSLTSGPIARTASRTALAIAAVGATAAPSPLRALVISFSAMVTSGIFVAAFSVRISIVPIRDHDKGVGIVSKNRRHSLLNSPDHADAAILTPPLEDELLAWKGGKGSRRQAVIV